MELSKLFSSLVEQSSLFELVVPPSFALTVFRLVPPTVLPTPIATTPNPGQVQPISTQETELASGTSPKTTTTKPNTLSAQPLSSAQSKANALNRAFYARISARKTLLLTQTDLSGTFCIRFAVGAVRTEEKHIREAFDVLTEEAQATLAEWRE